MKKHLSIDDDVSFHIMMEICKVRLVRQGKGKYHIERYVKICRLRETTSYRMSMKSLDVDCENGVSPSLLYGCETWLTNNLREIEHEHYFLTCTSFFTTWIHVVFFTSFFTTCFYQCFFSPFCTILSGLSEQEFFHRDEGDG